MQFERLRKSHKKEIIIGALAVCVIGGILTFATSRAFYRVDDSIDLAKGTINYKTYDFKIMAMYKSEDGKNYTEVEEMPSEGYTINESKSYCNMSNGNKDTTAILKTIDGNHIISKLKKNDKCFIYFDKYVPPITVDDIIAANNPKTDTPDFSQAATTDEGVYATSDGMYGGTSYYWRGAATTNHVIFANKCWRIVRINGDKTMRLIYNGSVQSENTCTGNGSNSGSIAVTSQAYNPNYDRSEYVGWTYTQGSQRGTTSSSNIKTQTEAWFNSNITDTNLEKVANGYFCNDRNVGPGYIWSSQPSGSSNTFSYASYGRSGVYTTSVSPTLSCSNLEDIFILKVGAISIDEVIMAGCRWNTANSSYYLYNGQSYWTMSPYAWHYMNAVNRYVAVFFVSSEGSFGAWSVADTDNSVRPIINLRSDITFSSGDGTLDNPYVVQ